MWQVTEQPNKDVPGKDSGSNPGEANIKKETMFLKDAQKNIFKMLMIRGVEHGRLRG